jgi:hypothetical protein
MLLRQLPDSQRRKPAVRSCTASTHLANTLAKLDVDSRAGIVAPAFQLGLS